ncbi:NAD(P)-binding domain-containing protein [Pseudaminobacter soli (ex Zhang et al. 2022)]|uniref:NAD(P)-binding domain-containing protein n=1 Tax=Pseudaminobacter soli (ex Zhang et al. 2022) TaxID=2831468 RepID=UPI003080849F
MNISIIGAGNMGKGLAALFSQAGHRVSVVARETEKAEAAARDLGNGVAAAFSDAAQADIVVLAVPMEALPRRSMRPAGSRARW